MAHKIENRISETSTSSGTGTFALSALTGFSRFADKMAVADTCWYLIEELSGTGALTGLWEFGTGTYSAANTLTRTTPLGNSSNAAALINFPASSTKRVTMTALAPNAATAQQWRDALSILSNPMTTVGDMIIGGTSGAPTRVGAGTANYVWTSNGPGSAPAWKVAAGGGASNASSVYLDALAGPQRTLTQKAREKVSVYDFGAIGTGRSDKNPLSSRYATLAAAQAVYPFVTNLTDQIDWAALQAMMNFMKTQGGRPCTLSGAKLNINRPVILETYYDIDFEGGEIGLQDQAAGRVFDGVAPNLNYPSNTNPAVLDGCAFYIINTPYYSKMRNGSVWDGRWGVCFYGTPNSPIFINMEFNYTQAGVMYYNGCQNPRYYNCGGVVLGVLHISSATCFPAGAPGAGDDFYFSDNVKLHNELGFSSFGAGSYPQFDQWFIDSILRPNVPSLAYQQPNQTYNDRNGNVITDPFWLNPTGSLVFMPFRNGRDCFGLYMHGLDIRGAFKYGYARVNTQIRDIHVEQCQYEQLIDALATPTTPIYLSCGAVVAGKVAHVNQLDYIDGDHPLFGYSGRGKSDGFETDLAWQRDNTTEVTKRFGRMNDRGYMKGRHYIADIVIPFADNQLRAQSQGADNAPAESGLDMRGTYLEDYYLATLVENIPNQFFLPTRTSDGKVRADLSLTMKPFVGQMEVTVWNSTRGGEPDFAAYHVDTAATQTLTLSQALNNGDTTAKFNQSIDSGYDSPRFAYYEVVGQAYGFMADGAGGNEVRCMGDGNFFRGLPAGGLAANTQIIRRQALIPLVEFRRGWAAVTSTATQTSADGLVDYQGNGSIGIKNLTGNYAAPNACDMLVVQVRLRQIRTIPGDKFVSGVPTSGRWRVGAVVRRALSGTGPVLEWTCTASGSPGTWRATKWETRSGNTASRPTGLTSSDVGVAYIDTTLSKMIFWTGLGWLT